jgi:hypothetical protein
MRVADYVLEQEYHISRRRLVNRAMLGWGVVQGFRVDPEALTVGKGVALDPQGRELVACDEVDLRHCESVLWLAEKDGCGLAVVEPPAQPSAPAPQGDGRRDADCPPPEPEYPPLYLLSAHYAEKRIDGVRIEDDCGGARCEANQLCETVVYSLRPVDCCPSGLPDCRCPRCAGEDECACDTREAGADASRQAAKQGNSHREREDCVSIDRGNHRQLALWSLETRNDADFCKPVKPVEAGCIEFYPDAGVPLACVTLCWHCGEPRVSGVVDSAHPRRLARPNEVLFDLIRGCDLTRVKDVGWRDWLPPKDRIVPFTQFAAMFDPPKAEGQMHRRGRRQQGSVSTRFSVAFTGPVRIDTLTRDVMAITLVQREPREDVGDMVRVPIAELEPHPMLSTDLPGMTRGFNIYVDSSFWEGEIDPDTASGFEHPTLVEIEIRTDFIVDCNGQEVAGGGRYVPSTGCTPGGRFLSCFTVVPDNQREAGDIPPALGTTQQEA